MPTGAAMGGSFRGHPKAPLQLQYDDVLKPLIQLGEPIDDARAEGVGTVKHLASLPGKVSECRRLTPKPSVSHRFMLGPCIGFAVECATIRARTRFDLVSAGSAVWPADVQVAVQPPGSRRRSTGR